MSACWPKVTVKDVCESVIDCVNKTAPVVDYETPYKMIRTTNVKKGVVNLAGARFVKKETFDKWTRRAVPKVGDVILTREAPLGDVGMITTPNEKIFLGQRLMQYRVDSERLDAHYLLYALQGPKLQGQLKAAGSGSTVEHIRVGDAENLQIELPPIAQQREIGKVLANYDNLIEINNRRIAILEDMAQSLYREWFVNFRYPGHEDNLDADGNPKLVDSPLGLIPEGWVVKTLKDFCSKIGSGATPRGGKGAYKLEGTPLIRSLNIYDSKFTTKDLAFIDDEQAARLKNVVVEPNDVLLNITGASVARCSIVPSAFTPARVNQHVSILRVQSDDISPEYLLYTLISKNGKARLLATAQGGATREALTKSDLENFKIAIPASEVMSSFNSIVGKLVKQKEILFLKNENLKKQRDMLLPKLISGYIEL